MRLCPPYKPDAFGYKRNPQNTHLPEPLMDAPAEHVHKHHRPRVEDDALVRGAGRFIADTAEPGQAYAAFVRSPHAFARIAAIDTAAARSALGVLARTTAAGMEAAQVGNIGRHPPIVGRGGRKLVMPTRPALARERVMHVGEAVAMVIAESALAAQDAAELVTVDYDAETPVTDVRDAIAPEAA